MEELPLSGGFQCQAHGSSLAKSMGLVTAGKLQAQAPLSALLAKLSAFRALAVQKDVANQTLHDAVITLLNSSVGSEPAVLQALAAYGGWTSVQGFTKMVDLPGLKSALQKYKYKLGAQLGSGSYGVVWAAVNRETRDRVAIKKLKHSEDGLSDSTVREICALRDLEHENIVRLLEIISTVNGAHVYLVLECLDCDLRSYLDRYPEASAMPRIKSVMYQLLRGVRHAHANSIMHRDLKPQNVLVNVASGQVKITDFGLARAYLPCDRAYSEKVVTLYYRAPELLLLGAPCYGTSIDMWSVGCIMAELINFVPLFAADSEIGQLFKIFEEMGTPTREVWPEPFRAPDDAAQAALGGHLGMGLSLDGLPQYPPKPLARLVPRLAGDELGLDLLARLLAYDPAKRISATQALKHPWFRDVAAEAAYAYAAMSS